MSASAISEGRTATARSSCSDLIDALASSQTFEHAPASRALLLYLFQHTGSSLNEYRIGTEALGRRQDFDPRTDSAVRVQLSRLRSKLAEYSAHEGKDSPVEVVLPRGGYLLEFVDRTPPVAEPLPAAQIPDEVAVPISQSQNAARTPTVFWTREHIISVGLLLALSTAATVFLTRRATLATPRPEARKEAEGFAPDSFWSTFVGSNAPVRILVPNPTFFKWGSTSSKESIHVRSVEVNRFSDLDQSPQLSELAKKLGQPTLSQEYMSVYDARSTLLLMSFLNEHSVGAAFSFESEYPADEMDKENVVLLGTGTTLRRFDKILQTTSLRFDPLTTALTRVDNHSRIVQRFEPREESGDVAFIPQMLACLPTGTPGKKALVVAGFRNQALLHFITSDAGQNEIRRRQKLGNSPFFEAVVLAEMNGNTPLRSSIVYFRSLPATAAAAP